MKLKGVISKYNSTNLVLRIFLAIVLGALLGWLIPSQKWISELGVVFVGALKSVAPVLVFILIVCSLSTGRSRLDRRFAKVLALYLSSTLLASFLAVGVSFAFPQKLELVYEAETATAPSSLFDVLHHLLLNAVSNPLASIADANYVGILVWSVLLGMAFKKYGGETTRKILLNLTAAVSQVVRWIINLAPFGIMGIVFTSVSAHGAGAVKIYGSLVLLLVVTMFMMALVVAPIIVAAVLRKNPYPLVLRCLKGSGVTAFFTRSSAANIPVNMALCEKLELDQEFYSVSIPLGATVNMNGAAITITVMALATVHTLGIPVDLLSAFIVCLLATLGACGTSGVAGGSLLLIPLACAPFGISSDISMQVVALGFVIGAIQDSLETALNSSTDVIYTATAEYSTWKKQGKALPKALFKS